MRAYKIVMLFFLTAAATPAKSAETLAPLNLEARYSVAWSGIPIGRIRITATEGDGKYHMVVDTKTSGVAKIFSDEKRVAEVEGHSALEKPYIPSRYESRPQKKNDDRTTLLYDAAGHLATRERIPDDDPKWRPPVPPAQVNTATDPITAGYLLRHDLYDKLAEQKTFTLRTYDGARLADMTFTVINTAGTAEIMDKKIPAVDTRVSRKPITGYTPKELKKFAKGDPEIHLYFSRDARFLPIRATVDAGFGQITATLEEINPPLE